jgi:predicted ATP-dependent endonuclease of OLD family
MIITRVKVENWRGIGCVELNLHTGLNILGGDNEEGKSSVVEAINKALCWDSTARKTSADKLDYIAPISKPTARPTVQLDMQFPDCKVTLTKVVADSKQHRECHLVVDQNGRRTTYKDVDAEKKLAELLSEYRDSMPLRCSEQGKPFDYLLESLPSAACSAITVATTLP